MYFRYFVTICPWKRVGFCTWTKLNTLHPRMHCAKFGWYWLSGSGEEDENKKSLQQWQQRQRRRTTDKFDKFGSENLTWAFSSGELKRGIFHKIDRKGGSVGYRKLISFQPSGIWKLKLLHPNLAYNKNEMSTKYGNMSVGSPIRKDETVFHRGGGVNKKTRPTTPSLDY